MNKEQILKEFEFTGTVIDNYELNEFLIVITRCGTSIFEYSFYPENGIYVRYKFNMLTNNSELHAIFKVYNA